MSSSPLLQRFSNLRLAWRVGLHIADQAPGQLYSITLGESLVISISVKILGSAAALGPHFENRCSRGYPLQLNKSHKVPREWLPTLAAHWSRLENF